MSQRSASHGAEFCHALTSSIGLGAFALACLEVALNPRGVSGFFYHSRMLAIVHLVTLGWITASILGSLYTVGPIALRVWIPAMWLDYIIAFGFVLIGIIVGMVAHFWLQGPARRPQSVIVILGGRCGMVDAD